jgi:hypothetical protein
MGIGQKARAWAGAGLGGLIGTAVMTVALAAETKLRPNSDGPVDYDASDHVVMAAANLLRRPVPRSERGRRKLFNLVHWGYGSTIALTYEPLRRGTGSEAKAAVVFYVGCQSMAFALFPTLGETPPPWRWKRELLISSITVHALYVWTVAAVSRAVRPSRTFHHRDDRQARPLGTS